MEFTKFARLEYGRSITELVAGGLPAGVMLDPRAYAPATICAPVSLATATDGSSSYIINAEPPLRFAGLIGGLDADTYYMRHVQRVDVQRDRVARLLADLRRGEQVMDEAGDWSSVRDESAIRATEDALADLDGALAAARLVAA